MRETWYFILLSDRSETVDQILEERFLLSPLD